jgi:hypothetical protein
VARRLNLTFVLCLLSCASGVLSAEDIAKDFASLLAAGEVEKAIELMSFPAETQVTELARERLQAAIAINTALEGIGSPVNFEVARNPEPAYLVALGGGPRPFWWRDDLGVETEVILTTGFSKSGRGQLRLYVVGTPVRIVALSIGFEARHPKACEEAQQLMRRLLNAHGAPATHPSTFMDCDSLLGSTRAGAVRSRAASRAASTTTSGWRARA